MKIKKILIALSLLSLAGLWGVEAQLDNADCKEIVLQLCGSEAWEAWENYKREKFRGKLNQLKIPKKETSKKPKEKKTSTTRDIIVELQSRSKIDPKISKTREIVTKVKKVQELTECWFSDSKDILSSQGPSYESLNTHCFNAIELDDIETLTALVYYFKKIKELMGQCPTKYLCQEIDNDDLTLIEYAAYHGKIEAFDLLLKNNLSETFSGRPLTYSVLNCKDEEIRNKMIQLIHEKNPELINDNNACKPNYHYEEAYSSALSEAKEISEHDESFLSTVELLETLGGTEASSTAKISKGPSPDQKYISSMHEEMRKKWNSRYYKGVPPCRPRDPNNGNDKEDPAIC